MDTKEAYNEVFNIGGDVDYSVNELAKTVMKVMGLEQSIRYLPARNEVVHAFADHSKAKRIFNITNDFVPLDTRCEKMAEWVSKVSARSMLKFSTIKIVEKLPTVLYG